MVDPECKKGCGGDVRTWSISGCGPLESCSRAIVIIVKGIVSAAIMYSFACKMNKANTSAAITVY